MRFGAASPQSLVQNSTLCWVQPPWLGLQALATAKQGASSGPASGPAVRTRYLVVGPQVNLFVVGLVGVRVVAGVPARAGHWRVVRCRQEVSLLRGLGTVLGSSRRLAQRVLQVRNVASKAAEA